MDTSNKALANLIAILSASTIQPPALQFVRARLEEALALGGPDVLHKRIEYLEQCFKTAFDTNQKFCKQLTDVEAAKALVEDEMDSLETEYDDLADEVDKLKKANADLTFKADLYQRGEANMLAKFDNKCKELRATDLENQRLGGIVNTKMQDVERLRDIIHSQDTEIQRLNGVASRCSETVIEKNTLVSDLQEDLRTARAVITARDERIARLVESIPGIPQECERLRDTVNKNEIVIEHLKKARSEQDYSLGAKNDAIDTLRGQLLLKDEAIRCKDIRILDLKRDNAALAKAFSELDQNTNLRKLGELQQVIDKQAAENEKLKNDNAGLAKSLREQVQKTGANEAAWLATKLKVADEYAVCLRDENRRLVDSSKAKDEVNRRLQDTVHERSARIAELIQVVPGLPKKCKELELTVACQAAEIYRLEQVVSARNQELAMKNNYISTDANPKIRSYERSLQQKDEAIRCKDIRIDDLQLYGKDLEMQLKKARESDPGRDQMREELRVLRNNCEKHQKEITEKTELIRTLERSATALTALRFEHARVCHANDCVRAELDKLRSTVAKQTDVENAAIKRIDQLKSDLAATISGYEALHEKYVVALRNVDHHKKTAEGLGCEYARLTEEYLKLNTAYQDYVALNGTAGATICNLHKQLSVEKEDKARFKDQYLAARDDADFWKHKQDSTFDQLQGVYADLKTAKGALAKLAACPTPVPTLSSRKVVLDNNGRRYFAAIRGRAGELQIDLAQYLFLVRNMLGFKEYEISDAQCACSSFSNDVLDLRTDSVI